MCIGGHTRIHIKKPHCTVAGPTLGPTQISHLLWHCGSMLLFCGYTRRLWLRQIPSPKLKTRRGRFHVVPEHLFLALGPGQNEASPSPGFGALAHPSNARDWPGKRDVRAGLGEKTLEKPQARPSTQVSFFCPPSFFRPPGSHPCLLSASPRYSPFSCPLHQKRNKKTHSFRPPFFSHCRSIFNRNTCYSVESERDTHSESLHPAEVAPLSEPRPNPIPRFLHHTFGTDAVEKLPAVTPKTLFSGFATPDCTSRLSRACFLGNCQRIVSARCSIVQKPDPPLLFF
ncbi:hypothetical protein METBIDRAFT_222012 [Metschnikowia bicuspidata var. bicuspidata NRRL YB-4993]|uniref:Uncharacterized protein n=1 Tax=Metschnikowia bicuspidata var. bicuspidata NRRL YB-4993 TaxID=869754 RepID=A0A1A0H610_9ASCO|nr:hypothetical protein METBIDRAFT_222012 [Metschnikowia bicuspidata var. bicuspidata NRRL YB-4993]OBA19353.1 hypothetical protein METBIDRAFT_222012 [Metschnikowia bicuspidata var. bicuspidata NRRL YB-4993]